MHAEHPIPARYIGSKEKVDMVSTFHNWQLNILSFLYYNKTF
jgi:hypothetical protein